MAFQGEVKLDSVEKIMADVGIDERGELQAFHTQNVLNRILKYIPKRSGATQKITAIQTDVNRPAIVTDVPYGKYLFYGVAMAGNPKEPTDRPLQYTTPGTGPHWDRAVTAAEGAAMTADLQAEVDRRKR